METTDGDLSFHYKKDNNGNLKGTMVVYVDDTLASGDSYFIKGNIPKNVESKKEHPTFVFAGTNVDKDQDKYFPEHTIYEKCITKLE